MFQIVLILFFIICFWNFYWKRRNLPPGPIPLPILGNLIELSQKPPGYDAFQKWKNTFGNVYTFWMAEIPVVVVADYELIKEHFIKDGETFSGRKEYGQFNRFGRGGDYGIIFIQGDRWKEQRRFSLNVLRDLGMSKPIMEEKILLEVGHLFEIINNELGCSTSNPVEINLNPLIEITIANIIHQLIFGFAYHDKKSRDEYAKWKDLVADHMRNFVSLPILLGLEKPEIFEYLPYFGTKLKLLRRQYEQIIDYCSKQIENHKKDEKDGNFQDYVEAYLTEIRKENPNFDQKQLVNILYDFFLAGQETTANTIIFALIFALNYPKTQERIHKELDKIVGSDRQITVADRSQLVYCQAFINEALRMSNLLPLNLYHTNLKDVEIAGYKIKAGTRIVPQISNILYDSKVFPNPQVFKPERFIDNNGNLKKIEEFVPFSVGKRQCLGESLAKMELHIILTNFFNNYKITAIENELPSMEKIHGVTVQPKPFKCLIQKRNQGF